MKLLLPLLLTSFCFSIYAQVTPDNFPPKELVIKTLLDKNHSMELELEDETFINNIQGYGCAVPAFILTLLRRVYEDF